MTYKTALAGCWISAFLILTFIIPAFALGQKNPQVVDEHLFGPALSIQKDNGETPLVVKLRKAAQQGVAKAQFTLAKTFVDQGLTPETEQEAAKWLRQIVINKNEELLFLAFQLLGEMRKIIRREYPNISDAEIKETSGSIGIAIAESGDKDAGVDAAIREAKLLFAPAQLWLEISYTSDANVRLYDSRILEFYTKMAAERLPRAMLVMGKIVINGWGVQQNFREAIKWYRLAAKYGLDDAQHDLAVIYSEGLGVPQDNKAALKWYKLAAEQDNASSQINLGNMYANSRGVQRDDEEAVKWYRKAAEQGETIGQYNLGRMYHNGRGVVRDETQAFHWTLKAALKGFSEAEFYVGYAYTHGEGVKQDYSEALAWYKRAASQGNTDAMNNISLAYAGGRGAEPDQGEVFRWAKMAAERGHTDAQAKMFVYYLTGVGIEPDFGKALAWGMVVQKQRENEEFDQTVTKLSKKLETEDPDQHNKAVHFAGELYRLHVQPYEAVNAVPSPAPAQMEQPEQDEPALRSLPLEDMPWVEICGLLTREEMKEAANRGISNLEFCKEKIQSEQETKLHEINILVVLATVGFAVIVIRIFLFGSRNGMGLTRWEAWKGGKIKITPVLGKMTISVIVFLVLFFIAAAVSEVLVDRKFLSQLFLAFLFPSLIAIWCRSKLSKRIFAVTFGSIAGASIWWLGVSIIHSGFSNPFIISAVISSSMLVSSFIAVVVCRTKQATALVSNRDNPSNDPAPSKVVAENTPLKRPKVNILPSMDVAPTLNSENWRVLVEYDDRVSKAFKMLEKLDILHQEAFAKELVELTPNDRDPEAIAKRIVEDNNENKNISPTKPTVNDAYKKALAWGSEFGEEFRLAYEVLGDEMDVDNVLSKVEAKYEAERE